MMMHSPDPVQLIRAVGAAALGVAHELLPELLPDGYRRGQEWVALNPTRHDTKIGSLGVNMESGRWNDFADRTAQGGDLVSLIAYLSRCTQIEAARYIDRRLGLGVFQGTTNQINAALQIADRRAEAQQQAGKEAQLKREKVAATAQAIWHSSIPANDKQPYLVKKRIPAFGSRANRDRLVIPLHHQGKIANLQFISAEGEKRFLSGGRVVGCYSPIGNITKGKPLYICEGWATGATIHLDTGAPVACALSAKNLEAVAIAFRERLGDNFELIIAGDDDRANPDNPGRNGANQAALTTGSLLTFPQWPEGAPPSLTDFNDLYVWLLKQRNTQP